ncbi:MAG TPA: hypothetical protein VID50_12405 [Candidatus Eisenbacteria bacterium]
MKRIDGTTKRTKLTVAGLFLMVALASAGCSGNALMNPRVDQTTSGSQQTAQNGKQLSQPGGQLSRP